ncbi:iron-sulfur cluster carrier protein ApbC [Marinihelvus fidelis]|uniref:Iron-sulfur cluster carrier protein n=1 Tax=Marinihelvus fidelis TaxID=2613842 RepID=A0A5N0TBV2_9GAMM|nr:iron-sulfur cluster carrier protein ApbC [Marinihelvus fidelis]KAA9132492.1 iron-sulfur cluster carrier protein ApbC [Marinihelvus fidelis]
MAELTEDGVRALLTEVEDGYSGRDLVSSGALRGVGIDGDRVAVDLRLEYPAAGLRDELAARVKARLETSPEISSAIARVDWRVLSRKVQNDLKPHPGIRNIIAVASGKGGVGKSTTAVNLALALAADGARVGLLDADIYGPSIPRMMGVSGQPKTDGKRIIPHQAHGLKVMSMGFLVEEESPMIWRGPMVTSALQQMLGESEWGELDVLVIDLPPGTGDIQLTLVQKIPVAGAVIVTTPQDIALLDARRALAMFRKLDVAVLGVVENMSTHVCSQCGHEEAIFGAGGGERMASDFELPLLGQLPLDLRIREALDDGRPTVVAEPVGPITASYVDLARRTGAQLAAQPQNLKPDLPEIMVHNA